MLDTGALANLKYYYIIIIMAELCHVRDCELTLGLTGREIEHLIEGICCTQVN